MIKLLLHADLLVFQFIQGLVRLIIGLLIILRFIADPLPGVAARVVYSLLGEDFSALVFIGGVAEEHGGVCIVFNALEIGREAHDVIGGILGPTSDPLVALDLLQHRDGSSLVFWVVSDFSEGSKE